MRILGIDPGYAIVGYGVIDYHSGKFSVVGCGAVTTEADKPFPERLKNIYEDLNFIIDKYKPDALSIERLYFNTNTTTAIDVAQARGVIVLAAEKKVNELIDGKGRALLRESGTEPVIRIMIEAETLPLCEEYAEIIAKVIRERGHLSE